MGDKSAIEWTDATWNPVRGCSRVSPGCGGANHEGGCYAEKIAARFSGEGQPFHGFAAHSPHGGRWTGKVGLVPDALDHPLQWRTPRRIFVNSMSDWAHEALPLGDCALVFGIAIAAACLRGHIFQFLTKRAARQRDLLRSEEFWEIANATAGAEVMERIDPLNRCRDDARARLDDYGPDNPPPGIWLGVSVEDQERADERIPHLLATPAVVRFLSCEPLIEEVIVFSINGPIDLPDGIASPLHWVICGGESGPRARPMHPDWARSLRDQCAAAGVSFFFKQWGEWAPTSGVDVYCHGASKAERQFPNSEGIAWLRDGRICIRDFTVAEHKARIRNGEARNSRAIEVDQEALGDFRAICRRAELDQTTDPLSATGFQWMYRVGKARAGRTLDGCTHDDSPKEAR